ncbi:restriction endonuclease subunit S [Xanthomonas campestris]|jgi:type I restriction enzyme S subunit|uniref:restriction endonuclease subunit S n=1 Tax=Xanthomonas campestris TaxID=339 RepID=UPI000E328D50|nr:restriction endonuclease subunit S [Xanthomonas campestris]MEA9487630.1 restriction endonuclease subunit S [Xanthomonas campestris]MEA9506568.1 restriction endonuclease subunit S [Xanthomonas campestris]MEA9576955.1 restriction endonuclease subunit S [Xanthomonas campestris]MEB2111635.1 restriction endonuclease subunit S [Xanthomonas campestris pv. campestris]RFF70488.1 restriction endonuclease subunit S [Xanthomonas campestris pv. campestris]
MLPKSWSRRPLHEVADVRTGVAKGKTGLIDPVKLPYLRVANVQDNFIDLSEVKTIEVERHQIDRYSLRAGDILMTEGGDFDKLGRGAVWDGTLDPCLHQNHVFAVRAKRELVNPLFLSALSGSEYGRTYFLSCAKRSTNLASINSSQLKAFPVLLPPISEQDRIAHILSTWDQAIATTERLLANSRHQKMLISQQVLTGKARLAGFTASGHKRDTPYGSVPVEWDYPRIGDVAAEISDKLGDSEPYPVLSCTKHHGLVDSLKYFKKQVFSVNTSTYKVAPWGCFVYATNHIDEGSIGYQNLYEAGLISPMYTVFKTNDKVVDAYLFALLKTEHYRQIFASAINASVDRRGSLRWKHFQRIHIPLPPVEEQQAIATMLAQACREVALIKNQLDLLREEKSALMSQLLTGKRRVRLHADEAEPA